jgi:hypothetical protein
MYQRGQASLRDRLFAYLVVETKDEVEAQNTSQKSDELSKYLAISITTTYS